MAYEGAVASDRHYTAILAAEDVRRKARPSLLAPHRFEVVVHSISLPYAAVGSATARAYSSTAAWFRQSGEPRGPQVRRRIVHGLGDMSLQEPFERLR